MKLLIVLSLISLLTACASGPSVNQWSSTVKADEIHRPLR